MKKKNLALAVFVLLTTSISCSFITGLASGGGGPENLTAELTAPDVVNLTWDTVEGATGYVIEISIEDSDFFPIVSFAAEHTSYEDLTAPEKTKIRYRVQVVTESGLGGTSTVAIETQERIPNPLSVDPVYDEENSTSAVIGFQGGTLSLVDSNGVEYTLEIPQGALSADTEIRMTPEAEIRNWPLDGDGFGGVKLEPEGLILNDVATLSIGIPFDIDPDLSIVGFAHLGSGEEFHLTDSFQGDISTSLKPSGGLHLTSPTQKPKNIIINPVIELKVHGVGQTNGSNASNIVKENAPTKSGDAFQQKSAAGETVDNELTPLPNLYPAREGERKAAEIEASIHVARTCKELDSQIAAYQLFIRSPEYSSTGLDNQQKFDKAILDEISKKVKEVLEDAAEECEESSEKGGTAHADSGCAKALLDKIINPPATSSQTWTKISNGVSGDIGDAGLQALKEKMDKCKKKAFHIYGQFDDEQVSGFVCDSSKPFKINGSQLMFEFTPTGENMGTYTYSGPYEAEGTGPYLIHSDGKMTMSGYGCITFPILGTSCDSYDHQWTADPLENTEECVDHP